jgi:hypothetical protein
MIDAGIALAFLLARRGLAMDGASLVIYVL